VGRLRLNFLPRPGKLAVLLLPLLSASALAQEPDALALRFAWPARIVLQVERTFERDEQSPRGVAPTRASSRYRWTGTRSGEEYRVAFSDYAVVQEEPRPTSSEPLVQLEYMQRALEPLLPTLVLDAAAQPQRIEGLEPLREKLRKEYAAIPGFAKEPQSQPLLAFLTSEATLRDRALEDWSRAVATWHGADTEIGATLEQEAAGPEVAGVPIRYALKSSVDRRVPCAGEAKPACVRLIVSQTPRFADARAASRALLGFDIVQGLGASPDAKLEIVQTFTTDTDPATLVPVRYVKEKRWSVRWRDAQGAAQVVGRTDRWTYAFARAE
jgi:hypothetical protein